MTLSTPQKHWHDLIVEDLLPGEEDGQAFFDRAVPYTMQLITENFPSLASLKKFLVPPDITVPKNCCHSPESAVQGREIYRRKHQDS